MAGSQLVSRRLMRSSSLGGTQFRQEVVWVDIISSMSFLKRYIETCH